MAGLRSLQRLYLDPVADAALDALASVIVGEQSPQQRERSASPHLLLSSPTAIRPPCRCCVVQYAQAGCRPRHKCDLLCLTSSHCNWACYRRCGPRVVQRLFLVQ